MTHPFQKKAFHFSFRSNVVISTNSTASVSASTFSLLFDVSGLAAAAGLSSICQYIHSRCAHNTCAVWLLMEIVEVVVVVGRKCQFSA